MGGVKTPPFFQGVIMLNFCKSRKTKRGACPQQASLNSTEQMCYYHDKVDKGFMEIEPYPEDGIDDFRGLDK